MQMQLRGNATQQTNDIDIFKKKWKAY